MDNQPIYGLNPIEINQIISILVKNSKIQKIILFGSRAKGNFQNGSDIDLSLIGNGLKLNDILNATIEIDSLSLPYKFDFVIYDRIKEKSLQDHIDRIGVTLFDRTAPVTT